MYGDANALRRIPENKGWTVMTALGLPMCVIVSARIPTTTLGCHGGAGATGVSYFRQEFQKQTRPTNKMTMMTINDDDDEANRLSTTCVHTLCVF